MNIGFGDLGSLGNSVTDTPLPNGTIQHRVCVDNPRGGSQTCRTTIIGRPNKPAGKPIAPSVLGPIAGMITSNAPSCYDKNGKYVDCPRLNKFPGYKAPRGGTISWPANSIHGLSGLGAFDPTTFNPSDPNASQADKVAYYKYITGMDVPSDTKFVVLQPQDDNGIMKFLNNTVSQAGTLYAQKLKNEIDKQHAVGQPAIVPVPYAVGPNWAAWGGGAAVLLIGGGVLWYLLRRKGA